MSERQEDVFGIIASFAVVFGIIAALGRAVTGNGLLGEKHQEMLALFRSLDPRLKRLVMSRAVEILEVTHDIKAAVDILLRLSDGAKQIRGG